MAIREINGRLAINRAGLAQRWDISVATLDRRIANDRPPAPVTEAAANGRQKWWWWLDEADPWMQGFEDRKRAALTPVDRSGDPDELLNSAQAARVLGYQGPDSLHPDFLALADDVEQLPSGNQRRRWRRRTVWTYAENRTGRGGTGAPRGSTNRLGPARRRIDRSGDPEELLPPSQAAKVLGYVRPASLPRRLLEIADDIEDLAGGRKRRRWRRRTLWAFADSEVHSKGPK